MKGRSNRLPVPSAPSEDWGDGSWTVDCPCGVTFDDGEEMVDCDVCGVWVHTRCSRYVKGEASFACDKCKVRKPRLFSSSTAGNKSKHGNINGGGPGATNTEETEVAQLLVELPTKTDPCLPLAPQRPAAVRLWTRAPIEERVHVQGVPGGDPALFQGLSSVFTSELWKCTGYMPKKFNFKYKEFPCWDDEEESENPASRGADLLFSLSKESTPCGLLESYGRRSPPKIATRGDGRSLGSGGGGSGRLQASVKKDKNKIRVIGLHSGKRKEEPSGGKYQSAKKKPRISGEKAVSDNRKRGSGPFLSTFKSNIYEDSVAHFTKLNFEHGRNEDRKHDVSLETRFGDNCEATKYDSKPKQILMVKASSRLLSNGPSQQSLLVEPHVKLEVCDEQDGSATQSKDSISIATPSEASSHIKEETDKESNDSGGVNEDSSSFSVKSEKSKPGCGDFRCPSSDMLDVFTGQTSNTVTSPSSVKVKVEVELVRQDGQGSSISALPPVPVTDEMLYVTEHPTEHSERSVGRSPVDLQTNDTAKVSLSCEDKPVDTEREPKFIHLNQDNFSDIIAYADGEARKNKQEIQESSGPAAAEEGSTESIHGLKYKETEKSRTPNSNFLSSFEIKLDQTIEKNSLNSSVPVFSKSSVLGTHKSPGSAASSTAEKVVTKQKVKMNPHTVGKKEHTTVAISSEECMKELTSHSIKSHLMGPTPPVSKPSQTYKVSHFPSEHVLTDAKECLQCPSSKLTSQSEKTANILSSGETTGSQQSQSASIRMRLTASGSCQKNENMKQPIPQPSTKINHLIAILPPSINASAQLSDEELALLLHQELNSSPRVPRVPRIRQAGGFQLTSNTATSILSRRSSSSGGKDQSLFSRRKNKEDAKRDSSHTDETKKIGRFPSSDTKEEDGTFPTDAKQDGHGKSSDALSFSKKSIQLCSTAGANSGCSSSMKADRENAFSIHNSPKNLSGDDAASQALTLPGLIDEIMSEGKCTTYEDLCNEVLPHWRNLRKPNGERYAYSSHSQAVLDCLRNRNEWAHLIDRVPKTNSSRKKRKPASDPLGELEDKETKRLSREADGKDGDSQKEDFPKGKRSMARKRRVLVLRGRGPKVSNRQKELYTLSEGEDMTCSASPSSFNGGSQSLLSDEDDEGAGPHSARSKFISSSDESV